MSAALDGRMPYKARPISFEPTRWELFVMWTHHYRRALSIGSTLSVLLLTTGYLLKLVSLNADIDRQWRTLETALRDRYATAPAYVACIAKFVEGDSERYTLTITEHGLAAWRTANTEHQIVTAAARMERVLTLLSKVMRRYDQSVPLKEPEQDESSVQFAKLERQRELSRRSTGELVQRYNATVANYNAKVTGIPGSWIAWAAELHEHSLIFASPRP